MPPAQRHTPLVRVTHWITTAAFLGLLVSSAGILLAHPRFYWGETGGVGEPSLFDLPIPLILGQSGWGRYLHFLSAWVSVLTGLVYVLYGFLRGHFRSNLLQADETGYNPLQRRTYLVVIFLMFPLAIASGLAMSPAITSVVPQLVELFGGDQSARTVHFFLAVLLLAFLLIHVAMVWRAGFFNRVRSMMLGDLR